MSNTLVPIHFHNNDDDRPLPLIVAERWHFALAYQNTPSGYFYAIQDWIRGLTGADYDKGRSIWANIKKQTLISNQPLPYVASDGKTYQRDFCDDKNLYVIAQYLRVTRDRMVLKEIKQFLADAGVFVDAVRRNPEAGLDVIEDYREYRKLLAEGFTPEEAEEWLSVRQKQKRGRARITAIWSHRGINKPKDFADLTNQVHRVALGRTATRHKRELAVKDTPRNYISAADNATIQITEVTSGLLHEHRESFGKPELSEDIDDVRSIIDAARPEIQKVFSQKPRRLSAGDRPKPELDE